MVAYFQDAVREHRAHPRDDLISAFVTAEIDGDRLTDEEIVANTIVTMVGGQETTTNLIGNGMLTLLRHPDQLEKLQADPTLIPSAVEELLRYESPSQHTARLAPDDVELGGKLIRKRQAVIAVMGAANRDPERFPDPDRLDILPPGQPTRRLRVGQPLLLRRAPGAASKARSPSRSLLRRMPNLRLEPGPLTLAHEHGLARVGGAAGRVLIAAQGPVGHMGG